MQNGGHAWLHLATSSCLPLLDKLTLVLGFLLGVFDRDVLALVRLEDFTDIRRFVDTDGYQFPVSLERKGGPAEAHIRGRV